MARTRDTKNAQRFWKGGVMKRRLGGRNGGLDDDFERGIRGTVV